MVYFFENSKVSTDPQETGTENCIFPFRFEKVFQTNKNTHAKAKDSCLSQKQANYLNGKLQNIQFITTFNADLIVGTESYPIKDLQGLSGHFLINFRLFYK
ncbi:MAG: hypothetical protein K9H64_14280 [Bacteroidales bacterium]|nr:hypothetical protein [Bacteroidales bacterium]MCF8457134.1 hypothetical protein [Bacteroidales bacterium]